MLHGGGNDLIYYKVKADVNDENYSYIRIICTMCANEINYSTGEPGSGYDDNYFIGPGAGLINNDGNYKVLAFGCRPYIKIVRGIVYDNSSMIIEGTFKQITDYFFNEFEISINIYDYIEEITEEEFYNIRYTE